MSEPIQNTDNNKHHIEESCAAVPSGAAAAALISPTSQQTMTKKIQLSDTEETKSQSGQEDVAFVFESSSSSDNANTPEQNNVDIDAMRKILKAATTIALANTSSSSSSSSPSPSDFFSTQHQVDMHLQDAHMIPSVLSNLILEYVHHSVLIAYERLETICKELDRMIQEAQKKSQPNIDVSKMMMKRYVLDENGNSTNSSSWRKTSDEISALEILYRTRLKLPHFQFPDDLKLLWLTRDGIDFGECDFTPIRLWPSMKRMRSIANDTPDSCTSCVTYCIIDFYTNRGNPSEQECNDEISEDLTGMDEVIRYDFVTGCVYHVGVVDFDYWTVERLVKNDAYQEMRKIHPHLVGLEFYGGSPVFPTILFPSLSVMFEAINRELRSRMNQQQGSFTSASSSSTSPPRQIDCETLIRLAYPFISSHLSKEELDSFRSNHWFLENELSEAIGNSSDSRSSGSVSSTSNLDSIRSFLTASERAFLCDARTRGVDVQQAYWSDLNYPQGLC